MSIANASASANAPRTPASPVKTRASTTPSFPTATAIQPALHPSIPTAITVLEPMPQQVGVRQQEAERDARQRRKPGEVAPDREDEREPEAEGHPDPRPADAETEARRGAEEEREEEDVGRAEMRRALLARHPEGHGEILEEPRLLRDDVLRRPLCTESASTQGMIS